MNILIFENEISYVENAFNYVNLRYFGGKLIIKIISKSQDLGNFKDIQNFDHVFVDISLAPKSELDGFGIIKKIKEEGLEIKKLCIITGNSNIKIRLQELKIDDYPVIIKPISFIQLYDHLKKLI